MPTVASAVLGDADLEADPLLGELPESEVDTGEGGIPPSEVAESEEDEAEGPTSEGEEEGDAEGEDEPAEEEVEEGDEPDEGEEPIEEEPAPAPRTQQRIQRLSRMAARAQKFEPILEMLENDPNMAREIVARRLGLVPQAPAREPTPAKAPERTAITVESLQKDPVGTLRTLIREELGDRVGPAEKMLTTGTVETLVDSFKARAATSDKRFGQYEQYFDALVERTDPSVILQNPKSALRMLKNMAFGEWYGDQTERIAKAQRANPPARPAQRGRRNALTTATGAGGRGQRSVARATRALTAEEQVLAERYGVDLVTPDEGE